MIRGLWSEVSGDPVFGICALVALAGAGVVVMHRSPIYSALGLMAAFLSFAALFVKLAASFLAAMHVLVYTGAILVLFLFVIMLLNLTEKERGTEHPRWMKFGVAVLAVGLAMLLGFALFSEPALRAPVTQLRTITVYPDTSHAVRVAPSGVVQGTEASAVPWGGVEHVGATLFTQWVFPFELVSLLIVVAILGAVVLAKKRLPPEA